MEHDDVGFQIFLLTYVIALQWHPSFQNVPFYIIIIEFAYLRNSNIGLQVFDKSNFNTFFGFLSFVYKIDFLSFFIKFIQKVPNLPYINLVSKTTILWGCLSENILWHYYVTFMLLAHSYAGLIPMSLLTSVPILCDFHIAMFCVAFCVNLTVDRW